MSGVVVWGLMGVDDRNVSSGIGEGRMDGEGGEGGSCVCCTV